MTRASDMIPYYSREELKAMDRDKLLQVAENALNTVKHQIKEIDRLHDIMTMNGVK